MRKTPTAEIRDGQEAGSRQRIGPKGRYILLTVWPAALALVQAVAMGPAAARVHADVGVRPDSAPAWSRASARIEGSTLVVEARLTGPGTVEMSLLKPAEGFVAKAPFVTLGSTEQHVSFRIRLPRRSSNLDLYRLQVRFHPKGNKGPGRELIIPVSRILAVPIVDLKGQRSLVTGSLAALRLIVANLSRTPIPGARVRVRITNRSRQSLDAEATTDPMGLAQTAIAIPGNWRPGKASISVTVWSSGMTRTVHFPARIVARAQVLLDLDKPVYQPGQIIHVRSLALSEPSRVPLPGAKVTVTVTDPRGNLVFEQSMHSDAFGVAATDIPLARGILTGRYEIRLRLDGTGLTGEAPTMVKKVKVYEYRPPILAVESHLDRRFYRPGQKAVLDLRAHHLWGSKVRSGKVRVSSSLVCTDHFRAKRRFGRKEYQGNFDSNGLYRVTIPIAKLETACEPAKGPASLEVSTLVTAPGGFVARAKTSVPVSKAGILLQAVPEAGRLVAGRKQRVLIVASTPDGRPARADLSMTLRKAWFTGSSSNRTGRSRLKVRTDRQGLAFVPLVTKQRARHRVSLHITASDPQGNRGRATFTLAVWKQPRLLVETSCSLCKAGDKVRIHVTGPGSLRGPLYVEIGGWGQTSHVLSATMRNGKALLWARLPKTQVGAVRVVAGISTSGTNSLRGETILFAHPGKRLLVRLDWNKTVYEPGKAAFLKIAVTDEKGAPRQAALGLAVVDEAIYAMTHSRPSSGLERFLLDEKASALPTKVLSKTPADLLAGPAGPAQQRQARVLAAKLLASGYKPFTHDLHRTFAQERDRYQKDLHRRTQRALRPWAKRVNRQVRRALLRYWKKKYRPKGLCMDQPPKTPMLRDLVKQGFLPAGGILDPWGHPMSLDRAPRDWCCDQLPKSKILTFSLQSMGPDGLDQTADDITLPRFRVSVRSLHINRNCGWGCGCGGAGGFGAGGVGMGTMSHVSWGMARRCSISTFSDKPLTTRRRMAETLVWRPMLRTNDNGILMVPLHLADNITTWTARVTASDRSGRLGFATARTKALKPLFVNVNLPQRLTRGDRLLLPVVVHNETTRPRRVDVRIDPAGWYATSLRHKTVDVPAHASKQVLFPISVQGLGPGRIRVVARSAGLSDALVRSTLVEPPGRPVLLAATGILNRKTEKELFVPRNAVKGTKSMTVSIESGMSEVARESLSSLLRQPSGCFEQNASITYPNILIHRLLGRRRDAMWKKAHRFVLAGYQRMLSYEVSGGGFSLFGAKPASVFLTALGLHMLADMQGIIPIDPKVVRRSLYYLARKQRSNGSFGNDIETTAYVVTAVARSKGRSAIRLHKALSYLKRHKSDVFGKGPYSIALTAQAFAASGRIQTRMGRMLLSALAGSAQRTPRGLRYWTLALPSKARPRTAQSGGPVPAGGEGIFTLAGSSGRSARVEVTALAAISLAARGNRDDLVHKALGYLLTQRDAHGAWYSTQSTVLALKALETTQRFLGARHNGTVTVLLDNRRVGTLRVAANETSRTSVSALTLDARLLTPGRHRILLAVQGRGKFPYKIAFSYRSHGSKSSKSRRHQPALSFVAGPSAPNTRPPAGNAALLAQAAAPQEPPRDSLEDVQGKARRHPEGPILSASLKYVPGRSARVFRVHEPITLRLTIANHTKLAAMSPMAKVHLAPGMEPMRSDLDRLVRRGLVRRYEIYPQRIILYLARLDPGRRTTASIHVVPHLSGTMAGPTSLVYDYYYPEGTTYISSERLSIR